MGYDCWVERDSVSEDGVRLTSFVITIPKHCLQEFNTHGMIARSAASFRAIPSYKVVDMTMEGDGFYMPDFGKNQPGMVESDEPYTELEMLMLKKKWKECAEAMAAACHFFFSMGVHKQHANRLMEPFAWAPVVCTATDWDNFFALRTNDNAYPPLRKVARMMYLLRKDSVPKRLSEGQWHLPFIEDDEQERFGIEMAKKVSVGRCARVSYLNHLGERNPFDDVKLADRLISEIPRHVSPYEHVATPSPGLRGHKFRSWLQLRKLIPDENITSFDPDISTWGDL